MVIACATYGGFGDSGTTEQGLNKGRCYLATTRENTKSIMFFHGLFCFGFGLVWFGVAYLFVFFPFLLFLLLLLFFSGDSFSV